MLQLCMCIVAHVLTVLWLVVASSESVLALVTDASEIMFDHGFQLDLGVVCCQANRL